MSSTTGCPFCDVDDRRVLAATDHAISFHDNYPISEGHSLIVPRRHVASLFDLTEEERGNVWRLAALVRAQLLDEPGINGFNIGVNDGEAAGQTVMHAHVHVIPRRRGDVPDPRGGIRWVLPASAKYWNDE